MHDKDSWFYITGGNFDHYTITADQTKQGYRLPVQRSQIARLDVQTPCGVEDRVKASFLFRNLIFVHC